MAHDVFISFATEDKHIADAMVHFLERSGVRCWIAPRDAVAGAQFGTSIIDAINSCELLILILSSHSNGSEWVTAEVERAASKRKVILPVRVEDVRPSGAIELYIAGKHWLDAIDPPMERHLEDLCSKVRALVGAAQKQTVEACASVAPSSGASSGAHPFATQAAATSRMRRFALPALLALAVLGAGAWWTFASSGDTSTVAGANSASALHAESTGARGEGAARVPPLPEAAPEPRASTTPAAVTAPVQEAETVPVRAQASPAPAKEPQLAPAVSAHAKEPGSVAAAPESSERDPRSIPGLDVRLEATREALRGELKRCMESLPSLQSDGESPDVLDAILDRERALTKAIGAAGDQLAFDAAKTDLAGLAHDVQARRTALTEAIENEQRNLRDAMNQLSRRLAELQPIVDERGTATERQSLVEIRAGVPALGEPGRVLTTLESQTTTANRHIRELDEIEKSIQARSEPAATDPPKPAATTLAADPAKYFVMLYREPGTNNKKGNAISAQIESRLRERGFSVRSEALNGNAEKKAAPRWVADKTLSQWISGREHRVIVVPPGTPDSVREALRSALNAGDPGSAASYQFRDRPVNCEQVKNGGDLSHYIDILSLHT